MTRKSEVIDALSLSLLTRVEDYISRPGVAGIPHSNPQMQLLAFCLKESFPFHAIIIAQGLLQCQEFNSLYMVWSDFQGKKFMERQNIEAFFINKCLLHKNTKYLKNKH
jgi:hypothetical protein